MLHRFVFAAWPDWLYVAVVVELWNHPVVEVVSRDRCGLACTRRPSVKAHRKPSRSPIGFI